MSRRRLPEVRPDFVRCRAVGHSWEPAGEVESRGVRLIALRCGSCTTLRYNNWNMRTGERVGNAEYVYPDNYRDRDPGHDRDFWRKSYVDYLFSTGAIQTPLPDTRRRRARA